MEANSQTLHAPSQDRDRVRKLTVTAMLSAVAFVLMFMDFPLPMIMPSFVQMDFSDLPELLGAFALGPVYGVLVALIKNLLHLILAGSTNGLLFREKVAKKLFTWYHRRPGPTRALPAGKSCALRQAPGLRPGIPIPAPVSRSGDFYFT